MPTHLTESDLDELEGPISPLLFPLYGVASRFSAHGYAIKVLAECFEHTDGAVGLADAMHESLERAADNLPDPPSISVRTSPPCSRPPKRRSPN
jgi:hypothetical protein